MALYFDAGQEAKPAVRGKTLYRFASAHGKHGRGRAALNRVNGCLKHLIDRIADAKMRRMLRELELRGIRFDPVNEDWMTDSHRPRISGG